ncbi:MAG: MBL fold metallo-hydrolase [Candidatus Kariarchaeaceae archaeon]|jgi:glyoxylase-like metal-dependent hydrolase (beta-lactamase superfamily II)
MQNWFQVKQVNDHLYLIRERFDLIDPRFYTKYTNVYLVLGTHSAILFDTGSGYIKINPNVQEIVGSKELLVFNSHNHFDHVGGNHEFPSVFIHRFDLKRLTKPIDVSFLKTAETKYAEKFDKINFQLQSSDEHKLLIGGEKFELGDIQVEVISTPGHTQGSICLLTSQNELLTGDTLHYGAVYLPSDDEFQNYRHTLNRLQILINEMKITKIYPAHEDYEIPPTAIDDLIAILENLEKYAKNAEFDEFLQAFVVRNSKYRVVYPEDYRY